MTIVAFLLFFCFLGKIFWWLAKFYGMAVYLIENKVLRFCEETLRIQEAIILKGESAWNSLKPTHQSFEESFDVGKATSLSALYTDVERSLAQSRQDKLENKTKKTEAYQKAKASIETQLRDWKTTIENLAESLHTGTSHFADIRSDINSANVELEKLRRENKGWTDRSVIEFNQMIDTLTALKTSEALTFYCNLTKQRPNLRPPARDRFLRQVSNPLLTGALTELYRDHATIGDGGTAAILQEEIRQTKPLKCEHTHYYKARYFFIALSRILSNEPLTIMEKAITSVVLYDLKKALETADQSSSFKNLLQSLFVS